MDLTLIIFRCCVIIIFVWLLIVIWQHIRKNWQIHIILLLRKIPGPSTVPILGNIHQLIGSTEYLWNFIRNLCKQYPSIFRIWAVNQCSVFLQNPDHIEILLSSTKNIQKSEAYVFLKPWLGSGLLISTGNKWKLRRKILTPAFHFNILKNFVGNFEKQNDHLIKILQNETNKSETSLIPLTVEYILYSLCETILGIQIDPENYKMKEYKKAIYKFGIMFIDRICVPWYYVDFIYFNFTTVGKQFLNVIETLQQFTSNIIKERLKTFDYQTYQTIVSTNVYEDDILFQKQKLPMLDLLITQMKQSENIDYNGIREEVDTFVFEGHDTTSVNISLLLMLLANNPDVQDRIVEEQNLIFGTSKRKATYEDLQNMQYLERCIKEGLRLYPSVPLIGRKLDEDLILDGYVIPATVNVYIPIYDVHRHPKYWPNPEKFDPDRFLPENSISRHPFVYIPFSAGPRNCIGQRFALLQIKSFISHVLREFILKPIDTPETLRFKADLVIRLAQDIRVKFEKRL